MPEFTGTARDILPVLNLILGMVGLTLLAQRTYKRRDEYPKEIKLLLYLTCGLFFGLLYVSAELLVQQDVPVRVLVVIFGIKVYALFVLVKTNNTKYRTGTRQSDGNPGVNPNDNIG